jgi:hypothetical protein
LFDLFWDIDKEKYKYTYDYNNSFYYYQLDLFLVLFGVLIAFVEDYHEDMETGIYVVEGTLTHQDSISIRYMIRF